MVRHCPKEPCGLGGGQPSLFIAPDPANHPYYTFQPTSVSFPPTVNLVAHFAAVAGASISVAPYIDSFLHSYQYTEKVEPNMSPTILFSGMYQKPFIYCRNRTNFQ